MDNMKNLFYWGLAIFMIAWLIPLTYLFGLMIVLVMQQNPIMNWQRLCRDIMIVLPISFILGLMGLAMALARYNKAIDLIKDLISIPQKKIR
jgi:hypothetical protein